MNRKQNLILYQERLPDAAMALFEAATWLPEAKPLLYAKPLSAKMALFEARALPEAYETGAIADLYEKAGAATAKAGAENEADAAKC